MRAGCEDIQKFLINWPRWLFAAGELAAGGQGDERALVITEEALKASATQKLRFFMRGRDRKTARVYLSAISANPKAKDKPVVLWLNPVIRILGADRSAGAEQPLKALLDEETVRRLSFGNLPDGSPIDPQSFATASDTPLFFDVAIPEGARGLVLQVEASIVPEQAGDAVLRLTISDSKESAKGTPVWGLLASPQGAGYQQWKADVLEFAASLPQTSHGEPTPSDKDPIPAPFDNTYNQPERDHFHIKLKYYRQDQFLVEKMLDDATRAKLDQAWNDLLASFGYHEAFLRFVAEKYKLDLNDTSIGELTQAKIDALPAEPRKYIEPLHSEYKSVLEAQKAGSAGHVEDCIRFAGKAWRRPLSESEKQGLRSFYSEARQSHELDHPAAIRALIARILIAPAFLYRLEQPAKLAGVRPLSGWEMASRLSYFLWSSMPDEELRRAAAAGELSKPQQLERQVKRMLADPKARRV
ncbi:MAG: DUF1592 domain-containing protein, partial [Bryobacteraceae bacterium]